MDLPKLNLGCGKLHKKGYINVDIVEPADELFDVREGIPFKDNNFGLVEADNLLEHFTQDEFKYVMNEVWRVLKPGGVFWIKVPDAVNWPEGAIGDPTHKILLCKRSFTYLLKNDPHYKNYGASYGFKSWHGECTSDGKFVTCTLKK